MAISSNSDPIPAAGFDPITFWLRHKSKILIYGAALLVAIIFAVIHQITASNKLAESQRMFAQAATDDDYRQIIQKFPNTVIAGNSILLLAEKLRNEKKYDDAITALQSMIDQYPDHPMIDGAWLSLGATYASEGKSDDALSTYQQITTKFATRYSAPEAMIEEAGILKSKGKLDDAKQVYENVKSQYPDSYFSSEAMQELQLLRK